MDKWTRWATQVRCEAPSPRQTIRRAFLCLGVNVQFVVCLVAGNARFQSCSDPSRYLAINETTVTSSDGLFPLSFSCPRNTRHMIIYI